MPETLLTVTSEIRASLRCVWNKSAKFGFVFNAPLQASANFIAALLANEH
jgi:hypothetical protein